MEASVCSGRIFYSFHPIKMIIKNKIMNSMLTLRMSFSVSHCEWYTYGTCSINSEFYFQPIHAVIFEIRLKKIPRTGDFSVTESFKIVCTACTRAHVQNMIDNRANHFTVKDSGDIANIHEYPHFNHHFDLKKGLWQDLYIQHSRNTMTNSWQLVRQCQG